MNKSMYNKTEISEVSHVHIYKIKLDKDKLEPSSSFKIRKIRVMRFYW